MDNFYLQKYAFSAPQIKRSPSSRTEIIIVIPCYNEPDIISTLESILTCSLLNIHAEVIIVVNSAKDEKDNVLQNNEKTIADFKQWKKSIKHSQIDFHLIQAPNLPPKHAGVGLARKIGMDEAVFRFHLLKKDGIIVCLDADSLVEKNYVEAIDKHFNDHSSTPGCSIHFEHPTTGSLYSEKIYTSIIEYELFLRYYKQGLTYAKLPFAYHTIGSSMAVRSSAYQKQGGMNKRKAGEDFYFLQKIIKLGNFTELNSTSVTPSPRVSNRVPFGTGKAIGDAIKNDRTLQTYDPIVFEELRTLSNHIIKIYEDDYSNLTPAILAYFDRISARKEIEKIKDNVSTKHSFITRFFHWFDAFKTLKFVHFLRDEFYPNISVNVAANSLLGKINDSSNELSNTRLLQAYRSLDKKEE